jgi:hypothetical protein
MAIQTRRFVEFDNGTVWWEYDWNDQTMRLTAARASNDCPGHPDPVTGQLVTWPTRMQVVSQTTGDVIEQTIYPTGDARSPAGTWSQNIPAGQANHFGQSLDARGRLLGIDHFAEHTNSIP